MTPFHFARAACLGLGLTMLGATSARAVPANQPQVPQPRPALQHIGGHMRPQFVLAPLVGVLPASRTLHLTIGLPLRNQAELQTMLAAISEPRSQNYRRYFTPERFAAAFSPTENDYAAVISFARAAHMTVTRTFANRVALNVDATAAAIQQAFHLTLQVRRRADGSLFYAPSNDPQLALATPILHIAGLDDYSLPKPTLHVQPGSRFGASPNLFSGPGGSLAGFDFRNVYAAGAPQTGVGQCVGLVEFGAAFFPSDINAYETTFGLPTLNPMPVLLDGFNGIPVIGKGEEEVAADIEQTIAMAPGLANVVVFEGNSPDSIFAAMASPPGGVPQCQQLSASWNFSVDSTSQQLVDEMALQGQSLFVSSGDNGGFSSDTGDDRDLSGVTVVGGTELSIDPNNRLIEQAWPGSGGGIESNQFVPAYQIGLGPAGSQGRLLPDVAMVAFNVWLFLDDGGQGNGSGTSLSTPLWASEMALINEQSQALGLGTVGFFNPPLYTIGKAPKTYAVNFNDIVIGNNGLFNTSPGYDLVTGWGSPRAPLIATLNPKPTFQFSKLEIDVYTGNDDLRPDSDLQVSFNGIGHLAPICLMRSNNGAPSGFCQGSAFGDEHGTQGWPAWSTQHLIFTNRLANWTWSGSGTMQLKMFSHNNGLETNDDWDVQAMTVTLSNPATNASVTLFNVGNFNAPHVSGNCYWRFRTAGSPPTAGQTFKLLPQTTPSNGCPGD